MSDHIDFGWNEILFLWSGLNVSGNEYDLVLKCGLWTKRTLIFCRFSNVFFNSSHSWLCHEFNTYSQKFLENWISCTMINNLRLSDKNYSSKENIFESDYHLRVEYWGYTAIVTHSFILVNTCSILKVLDFTNYSTNKHLPDSTH